MNNLTPTYPHKSPFSCLYYPTIYHYEFMMKMKEDGGTKEGRKEDREGRKGSKKNAFLIMSEKGTLLSTEKKNEYRGGKLLWERLLCFLICLGENLHQLMLY